MSSSKDSNVGFSWLEDQIVTGWLAQFKALLRMYGAHLVLERPRPSD